MAVIVDGMNMPFWDLRHGSARFWSIRTRLPFARTLTKEEREILGQTPESTYNVLCTRGESAGKPGEYECPRPPRVALVK